jgi:hypothetical protein
MLQSVAYVAAGCNDYRGYRLGAAALPPPQAGEVRKLLVDLS